MIEQLRDPQLALPPPTTTSDALTAIYPTDRRHYFLFSQGVKRTNMQYVELLALLKLHGRVNIIDERRDIGIISPSEATEFLEEYLARMSGALTDTLDVLNRRKDLYFSNKIVLIPYATSAEVWLPSSVDIDLSFICGESGYIHSCGDLLFSKDLQDISSPAFESAISNKIKCLCTKNSKVLLAPYCHEDFSLLDRKKSLFLQDGLDDVKLHISKAYLGQEPLYKALERIQELYIDDIMIAPRDYTKSVADFRARFPNNEKETIWILADFEAGSTILSNLGRRFLISYHQRFRNQNPYHSYEENKPAWASHTTLPHSLAGAMINAARPWLPPRRAQMCDPFSGSGTIYLESQKIPDIKCNAFDKSPLANIMLRDNISFFRLPSPEPQKLRDDLIGYRTNRVISSPRRRGESERPISFARIVSIVEEWSALCDDDFLELNEDQVNQGMSALSAHLIDRVALYCALRASVRGKVSMDRKENNWEGVFDKEVQTLSDQMENHIDSVKDMSPESDRESMCIVAGGYSPATVPPTPFEAKDDLFRSGDAQTLDINLLPKDSYDLIVCDPPYGFNTESDAKSAAEFADMLVPRLVDALKSNGGQIVMAAPRISNSGREIPLDLRSDTLARAIIDYCGRTGRECWKPASILPCPLSDHLQVPYYWRSDRALIRRILHFWIRPKGIAS